MRPYRLGGIRGHAHVEVAAVPEPGKRIRQALNLQLRVRGAQPPAGPPRPVDEPGEKGVRREMVGAGPEPQAQVIEAPRVRNARYHPVDGCPESRCAPRPRRPPTRPAPPGRSTGRQNSARSVCWSRGIRVTARERRLLRALSRPEARGRGSEVGIDRHTGNAVLRHARPGLWHRAGKVDQLEFSTSPTEAFGRAMNGHSRHAVQRTPRATAPLVVARREHAGLEPAVRIELTTC